MQKKTSLFVIIMLSLFLASCSFFEPPEASLIIRDKDHTARESSQYTISIEYTDGTRQTITKIGTEIDQPIPLDVNGDGGTITVNKTRKDGQKVITTSTGRVECKTIVNEINVPLRPVGETKIDITMTPGGAVVSGEKTAFYSSRNLKKGKAEFDKAVAVSKTLEENADKYGTVIYKGEPTTEINNYLRTIPIEYGRENASEIVYLLYYKGMLIDRVEMEPSDYMKDEEVLHEVDSPSLLSYDINPEWTQDGSKLIITWDTVEELESEIKDVRFSYKDVISTARYYEGKAEMKIDENVDEMKLSYTLTYFNEKYPASAVHSITHKRDKSLRDIIITLDSPLKANKTVNYEITFVPADAEVENGKLSIHRGLEHIDLDTTNQTITGLSDGEVILRFSQDTGRDILKVITVTKSPMLDFSADGKDITLDFIPDIQGSAEITLQKKVGSMFKDWRDVETSRPLDAKPYTFTEESRRFPVWYRAVWTYPDTTEYSTAIRIDADDIIPPPPDEDSDVIIKLPIADGPVLTVKMEDNTKLNTVDFTLMSDSSSSKLENITWYFAGKEYKGTSFSFDILSNKAIYSYENTIIDESNEKIKTLFVSPLTVSGVMEDKLYSTEKEVWIDVTAAFDEVISE